MRLGDTVVGGDQLSIVGDFMQRSRALRANEEIQFIVRTLNDTAEEYPADMSMSALFEAQVDRQPDGVALVCGAESWSYRQLNERVNQLAHMLRARGVRVGGLVGLHMERSLDLVIGVLGVLKAGAAYVPLDPELPIERLNRMVADCGAALVLCDSRRMVDLDIDPRIVLPFDEIREALSAQPVESPGVAVGGRDLAYIMYTSGSTGTPKGVMVEHRSWVNFVDWLQKQIGLGSEDRLLVKAPIGFDISALEMLWPLVNGAVAVIAPSGAQRDPQYLLETIAREKISILQLTPSMLQVLVAQTGWQDLRSLRHVLCGGDVMSSSLAQAFFASGITSALSNFYGPTETAIGVSRWACRPGDRRGVIPIGAPMQNIQFYILDATGQPQPVGVVGELHIAGVGLARGYLNQPELTQRCFIDNPWGEPGSRMYRTGDLARWTSEGVVEFVGRADQQLKLRGQRLEPGEIEHHLLRCAGVRQAAVVLREDEPGDARLVAYVVGAEDSPSGIRHKLRRHLPTYMLPSAIVKLESLPLTVNGKLDARRFPVPDAQSLCSQSYEAPQGEVEQTLAAMWQELLKVPRVGRHDNFFELGGHSLLAIRLANDANEKLAANIRFSHVLKYPTIAALAEQIEWPRATSEPLLRPSEPQQVTKGHLSFSQQQLWITERFGVAQGLYNVPVHLELVGEIDFNALRAAVLRLIEQHQTLRTIFTECRESVWQRVLPMDQVAGLLLFDRHDVDTLSAAQVWLANQTIKPFVLEQDLMVRCNLVKISRDLHWFALTFHHIAVDEHSIKILLGDVTRFYTEILTNVPAEIREPCIRYIDYVSWERGCLTNEVGKSRQAYWGNRLKNLPHVHSLPTDFPRVIAPDHSGKNLILQLPAEIADKLRHLAKLNDATLAVVLQAVFGVLLARYGATHDVVFGVPTSVRSHQSLEGIVGYFVNPVVFRLECLPNQSFVQFLMQTRLRILEDYSEPLPFDHVVELINPPREVNRHPLFQVVLAETEPLPESIALPGGTIRPLDLPLSSAKFDLVVSYRRSEDALSFCWNFATGIFDSVTIQRMAKSFITMLSAIAKDPNQNLEEIALLAEEDKQFIVCALNDTVEEYPADMSMSALFEAQVDRQPDGVALVCGAESWSYRQLNERANQLAHMLRARGVRVGGLVGLHMERSLDLVIGVLGVLKAGAAYVPLDPELPIERLNRMVADCGAALVLCDSRRMVDLDIDPRIVLPFDEIREALSAQPVESPGVAVGGRDLAYIMYTSGSTGTPKGVMVEHRSWVNFVDWLQKQIGLGSEDRLLVKAPIGFDISALEMLWPLVNGAVAVIAPSGAQRDPQYLLETIAREKISILQLTPSMLQVLITQPAWRDLRSLRHVICGGDVMSSSLAQAFFASGITSALSNFYGPTETAIGVSRWACRPGDRRGVIPIGAPMQNIQFYILDATGQPQPVGVVGELHIAGVGLARGYLNQPELTQRCFIDNPWGEPGSRMYRTGDLARWTSEGVVEFVGRADQQLKLRGQRLEPGEIEHHLLRCAGVRQAAVVLREDEPGDARLVAYVVGAEDSPSGIRHKLRRHLPTYMLPSAIVKLESLPLTVNGKLDARRFPVPDAQSLCSQSYEAPQGEVEQTLAAMWQELLKVPRVGRHDNFFELGGHSLLAIRCTNEINVTFGLRCPQNLIFESPELVELARAVLRFKARGELRIAGKNRDFSKGFKL